MALVLAAAPLIGGLARLQGFPVPWALAEAGMAWSWCAAAAVVLAALHLWMASGTESGTWLKTGCSLLALAEVWNVFAGSMPETAQFSLSSWHEAELWAFLGAGVLMMAGRLPETGKLSPAWWMLAAGIGGVLLVYAVGVAASVDVAAFPYAKRAELMSGWVGMSACVHAVAMLLCLAGACGCGSRIPPENRIKPGLSACFRLWQPPLPWFSWLWQHPFCMRLLLPPWRSSAPSKMRKAPVSTPRKDARCAIPR